MTTEARQPGQFVGDRSKKLLECSREATGAMKEHFRKNKEAKERGEPVVWTGPGATEILRAMDIQIHFPIHYSALCAARQMSRRYLDNLQTAGFSKDICRYCGQQLGHLLDPNQEDAPWGGPPKPDLQISWGGDDLVNKIQWYKSHVLDYPVYTMDSGWPMEVAKGVWHTCDVDDFTLDYAVKQLKALMSFLENFFHRPMDMERLKQAVAYTTEMFRLFWEVDQYRKRVPTPVSSADHFSNMIPIMFFRGMKQGVEMLTKYRDQVKERYDKGLAAVPNEKVRLYWAELPPWFTPGIVNAFEEKYSAAMVLERYHFPEWYGQLDPDKPIEALAKMWVAPAESRHQNAPGKIEMAIEFVREYTIDGIIIMWAESCKALANSLLLGQRAYSKIGVPSLLLRGDMVDSRDWDDAKIKSEIGAFIETLDPSPSKRAEVKRRATEFLEKMGSTLRAK